MRRQRLELEFVTDDDLDECLLPSEVVDAIHDAEEVSVVNYEDLGIAESKPHIGGGPKPIRGQSKGGTA